MNKKPKKKAKQEFYCVFCLFSNFIVVEIMCEESPLGAASTKITTVVSFFIAIGDTFNSKHRLLLCLALTA